MADRLSAAARARRAGRIHDLAASGQGVRAIARALRCDPATVSRVLTEPAMLQQQRAVGSAPARVQATERAERQGGVIDGVVIDPPDLVPRYDMAARWRVDVSVSRALNEQRAEVRAEQDRQIAASRAETARCEAEIAQIKADVVARKVANAERLRQRRLADPAMRFQRTYIESGLVLPPEALR